ncbi:hypothetical protein Sxan_22530 [Streptomyces xanthophaeus]|uniref:Uncharacterized protein n=1 Tax=Streptomyces xanthophaeus TaxID=67385 RepID=A0A919LHY1_9ACTN|nr:hypothetical protein Sxan_22530 [Streptomyces xanthophaeus]
MLLGKGRGTQDVPRTSAGTPAPARDRPPIKPHPSGPAARTHRHTAPRSTDQPQPSSVGGLARHAARNLAPGRGGVRFRGAGLLGLPQAAVRLSD